MITCEGSAQPQNASAKRFFQDKHAVGFYEWHGWMAEKGLERLVFHVARKPKNLEAHLERIYYCFQEDLHEQLYGALVDLLIVMHKDGANLARRMVLGSKSRLSEQQYQGLMKHIESHAEGKDLLALNRFSVFTRGLQSMSPLIREVQEGKDDLQDPMTLARGYIKYNHIDNAIYVLEQGVLADPGRLELHKELLALYRSTKYQHEFEHFYGELQQQAVNVPPGWQQLKEYFASVAK